jgi:ATP-binding cassette subfamily B protein
VPRATASCGGARPTRGIKRCSGSDSCSPGQPGKEVRLFGFERYLLDGWQDYYKKFRAQFVSLLARRSATWGPRSGPSLLIALATLSVLRRAARQHHRRRFLPLRRRHRPDSESVRGLLNGVTGIYESLLYMRNLFEFLELPSRNLDEGETWRGPIDESNSSTSASVIR